MKRYLRNAYWVFALLASQACEEVGDCGKREGDWVRLEISVDSFSVVRVYQNIDVEVISAPEQRLELEFGEKLIDEFYAQVNSGVLSLENLNSCNWVRSYQKPKVYLYTPSIVQISQFGSGSISNSDTIRADKFHLEVESGSGDISLTVVANEVSILTNGSANITLNGKANIFRPSFYWNNGRLYAYGLEAEKVIVRHRGYNDLFIWANQEIEGFIENEGHVYYHGTPSTITVEETWNGQLRPGN